MNPQPQPQQQAPMQPQQQAPAQQQTQPSPATQPKPSGRAGQPYNAQVLQMIEQHLNSLPQDQQQFLHQYMTPELAKLFGIVLGQEALDYFSKFADPKMMLVVQPRPQQQGGMNPQGVQGAAPAQQQAPQQQSNPPQANIMGR